jgi:hypothetical protein
MANVHVSWRFVIRKMLTASRINFKKDERRVSTSGNPLDKSRDRLS